MLSINIKTLLSVTFDLRILQKELKNTYMEKYHKCNNLLFLHIRVDNGNKCKCLYSEKKELKYPICQTLTITLLNLDLNRK